MAASNSGPSESNSPPRSQAGGTSPVEKTSMDKIETPSCMEPVVMSEKGNSEHIPSDSPDDPLNWPIWRKDVLLWIVALHTMQGPFSAATTIPAFMAISKELGVDIDTAAFLTSVPIIFLGTFPIIWSPFSDRIGRRPVYLLSAIVSAVCSLSSAFCHSYGTLMATRILLAIFMAPPLSLGACTVEETYPAEVRGQKMGLWALMVTIGPPLGPIVVGYLIQIKGWRSALYLTAAMQLALFMGHFFFGPETLYQPDTSGGVHAPRMLKGWRQYVTFPIYNRKPLRLWEFIHPFIMGTRLTVLLPSIAYGVVFTYTNILVTVFVPQIFGKKFGLRPGSIGLQMIAQLIGAIFGELLAGRGSDVLMNWRSRKTGIRRPEYRLPLLYPGFILSIVGLIVWGVQLQNATAGHWNITPDIGSVISIIGQQIVASVCTTYAIESWLSDTASVSAFVGFFRQLFGFLGPFYLGHAVTVLGTAKVAGLLSGIMAITMVMMIICHIWGPQWRAQ